MCASWMWGESTSYCCQASLPKAGLDTAATLLLAEVGGGGWGGGGGVSILPRLRLAGGTKFYASRWYPQTWLNNLITRSLLQN